MKENIQSALRQLEVQNDCHFVFAAESGSRAWGFASPDSDYDVRAIYVKPLTWYLTVVPAPKDTIETMLPGDLDISAWELRKALQLFGTCNLSLNEWLTSPIQYFAQPEFLATMRALLPQGFNPIKATHHYLALARNAYDSIIVEAQHKTISIKKLFYLLRGLLAAKWCCDHQSMPPVAFAELMEAKLLPKTLLPHITDLLAQKHEAAEDVRIVFDENLDKLYKDLSQQCLSQAPKLPTKHLSHTTLDAIFQSMITI